MRRALHNLVLAFCCVLAIWVLQRNFVHGDTFTDQSIPPEPLPILDAESSTGPDIPAKMIVMGKLSSEKTDWVEEYLPDWSHSIYVVDNTSATLHTTKNKGREANAYLTFIIENYHNLPNVSVFIHSHQAGFPEAWHTDAIGNDIVNALSVLNTLYVQQQGYVNLRCNPDPGCYGLIVEPHRHIHDIEPLERDAAFQVAWLDAWPYLLFTGDEGVPKQIAAACCAQFAVSREKVLERPREDYVRYHQWLMDTTMSDEISGRIMEYSWHMIFGKEPVHCPDMLQCYRYLYYGKNPNGYVLDGISLSPPRGRIDK